MHNLNDNEMTLEILTKLGDALAEANSMGGPIRGRLKAFLKEQDVIFPALAQAYDEFVKHLEATISDDNSPAIGDPFPDFLLPNHQGRLTSRRDIISDGPTIISFNRGHWCPFCTLELHSFAEHYPRIQQQGGKIISIMPERQFFTQKMRTALNLPFPVLSDMGNGFGLSLGLVVSASPKIREIYLKLGLNLAEFQSSESWFIPIPATFAIDQAGIIRAKFVVADFRKRMEPDDILVALKAIEANATR